MFVSLSQILMDNKKELIKKLQDLDPLKLAEDAMGASYKEDDFVGFTGMLLQMEKSEMMNKLMDITDDTKFSETTEEYLRKVKDFGFEVVYEEDFKVDNIDEKFFILWHKEFSILLSFDTYHGNRNSGHIYYNWSPNTDSRDLTSSGHYASFYMDFNDMQEKPNPEKEPRWDKESWDDFKVISEAWRERNKAYVSEHNLRRVWSGDHDCREGIKNQISLMAENGFFLNKWVEKPYMWLYHHGDKQSPLGHSDAVMEERYSKLPDYVKNAIENVK
jgi:hypothetical protein